MIVAVDCIIPSRQERTMPEVLLGFWIIISDVVVSPWDWPLKNAWIVYWIYSTLLTCLLLRRHRWILTHSPLSLSVCLHLLIYFKACPVFRQCCRLNGRTRTHNSLLHSRGFGLVRAVRAVRLKHAAANQPERYNGGSGMRQREGRNLARVFKM